MTGYYQWSNQNEFRKYPLREEASLIDSNGSELPVRILADLQCYVPGDPNSVFVRRVILTSSVVSIMISSASGVVLAITRNRSSVQPWTPYDMVQLDGVSSGRVVFGDLANVDPVSCLFSGAAQSGIEPRCIRGWHETVLSVGKRGRSEKITGVVTFSPDVNISLEVVTDGCYSVDTGVPLAPVNGVYVPSGTLNNRPVFINIDHSDLKLYMGSTGKWRIGSDTEIAFESDAEYPDRPAWYEVTPQPGGPYTPNVLRCNLVEIGLSKSTMEQFLGPCDRAGLVEGSKVLRTLGGAPSNTDGTIRIVATGAQ